MVWGSFPDAVDVVKPNDIFHLLMSHFHLGCLKVADSYTYFSYLMVNLRYFRLMFFGLVLDVVHSVGQCMSGNVGICGWHGIMNDGCPFVVKIGSSDDYFS